MPIWDFVCPECHHEERDVLVAWRPLQKKVFQKCPKCDGPMEREIGHSSFVLKGEGWYRKTNE